MRTTINRIGKYELKAILARTPMSTVYDGWDSDIARRVAIKLMPLSSVDDSEAGEAFARFKRGAQAAGQLNHPNIVAVYDYGETDDYAYLVMEFVDGSTLKAMFDDNQRFALPEICRIIGSVLEALQYSHDRGVVHRDVKPANIMFTASKQVKLTDFGIARLEDSEMTQAGMVIGTPAYMSPEQFLGERIDWRTDIYSTGVVLYHMLTGERPYEGNLATIMHKVLYGSPLLPSRVSTLVTPAVDAVVTRSMARNREDRYKSAAEFGAALQAAATGATFRPVPVAVGAAGLAGRSRPSGGTASRSSAPVLIFAALATVALAAGGWYGFLRSTPTSTPQPDTALARVKQEQARHQQEQELARLQQEQQQEQVRRQQAEDQIRQQQEQDQVRLQQEQEQATRQQEEEQRQAALQQQQEQARQRLAQEQARQKQAQDQARQKQAQDQARQKQAQDQTRQKLTQDQARPKQEQEQARPKQEQEQARQKPEQDSAPTGGVLPTFYPVTSTNGAAGLVCQTITAETAGQFGLDGAQGVVVTGVLAGGAADRAGIRERDVILKIKGSEIHDLSLLSKVAADGSAEQTIPVDILRQGARKVVQLRVGH
jgi:hypothetical protein